MKGEQTMTNMKPCEEFDCEGFRCVITRKIAKRPAGIDLEREGGFAYDERGRYWTRIVTDTPSLRVEERQHQGYRERIERHYPASNPTPG
jgi:hypothetical protein